VLVGGGALLLKNERDEWELPGGGPEDGERLEGCVVREVREETGLRVEVGPPLGTCVYEVLPGAHVLVAAYGCDVVGEDAAKCSEEHSELAVFGLDELGGIQLPRMYARWILAWAGMGRRQRRRRR